MANKLVSSLVGGINVKTSPLILKDSEAELILNYNLDTIGALTKRLGYITYASRPVAANKTCNGLYNFTDTSGNASEQLYVANNSGDTNGVIYYNSSGTWTAAKSDDTASKKSRFFSFVDYVFRVNGSNVVASSADGVTWGTTNSPATITPSFGIVFQDRGYVANGGTSTGSRLWFSSLPSSGTITWTTANDYIDVNPDDGDQITALENNGNRLLIFKNRALYRWNYGQVEPDKLIGVGTSSQESVKTNFDIGITFFANQNGIYGYSGDRPKILSRKIQKFIDAVSDWTNVFGEVDNDHYYLSVGNLDVNIEGLTRTLSNVILVYHISLDAWTIYTTATPVKWFARLMPTSPVENIYFGDNTGRTYQFLSGTSDLLAGVATEISGEIRTKEYLLALPHETSLKDITILSSQRVNADIKYQLNRLGNWIGLKDLTSRFTRLFLSKIGDCQSVRLHITDNSKNTSIIEGFNFHHNPKPDKYD